MFNKREIYRFTNRAGRFTIEKTLIIASVLMLFLILFFAGSFLISFLSTKSYNSDTSKEQVRDETMSADETKSSAESVSGNGNGINSWLNGIFGNRTTTTTTTTAGAAGSVIYETTAASAAETTAAASTVITTAGVVTAESVSSTEPVNTANMYSSYAIMNSYDPNTGVASFDYFDMLRGEDAIDWLVEQEGYTRSEAEETVNNFADSEFVYKNINPQLRYANMSIVAIKMMYNPDGSELYNSVSVPFTYDQFYQLYSAHPELVTFSPYFYYCTVNNNVITGVEQIYWP